MSKKKKQVKKPRMIQSNPYHAKVNNYPMAGRRDY